MEAIIKNVFGMRGCGKTEHIKQMVKNCPRLLTFDTLGHDYNDGVVFDDIDQLKTFWKKVYKGNFRLIYRPPTIDKDEIKQDMIELCNLSAACGNLTFVVEEIKILFDGSRIPREFNRLIFAGRHSNIELIGVAQRPFGFGRDLTSMAKEICVFYTREPNDLKYYADMLGKDAAEAISKLELYHYLRWNYSEGVQKWEVRIDDI